MLAEFFHANLGNDLGRVAGVQAADGGNVAYDYDAVGNLVSLTDPRANPTIDEVSLLS